MRKTTKRLMAIQALCVSVAALQSNAWAQTAPQSAPILARLEPAYVAPARGLNVRADANPQAPILATLWQGARVFVRDQQGEYVRIDGFGVAGYAFVDADFLTAEPSPLASADARSTPVR